MVDLPEAPAATERPALDVAVVMRRERLHGPLEPLAAVALGARRRACPTSRASAASRVCCATTTASSAGCIRASRVELFRDDAEGYYLNARPPARRAGSCCGAWTTMPTVARRAVAAADGRQPELQRGRPLARRAGDGRPRAGAARGGRLAARLTSTSTTCPSRSAASGPESFKPLHDRFGNAASVSTEKKCGRGRRCLTASSALVAPQAAGARGRRRRRSRAEPVAPPPRRAPRRPIPAGCRRVEPEHAEAPPPPTLDDVAGPHARLRLLALRRAATSRPRSSNAAMKKLFTDPHFNVMDGLDIYIDDYRKPDPLPARDAAPDGAAPSSWACSTRTPTEETPQDTPRRTWQVDVAGGSSQPAGGAAEPPSGQPRDR